MKNKCSRELKILIAAAAVLLMFFTAVVVKQVFGNEPDDVKFVYNLSSEKITREVNL